MRSPNLSYDIGWQTKGDARVLPRGLSLGLTFSERRLVLMLLDLLLVNGALAIAVTIWLDLPPNATTLVGYAKWFLTLSVLWLVLGHALDIYDLARAGSLTYSTISSALTALIASLAYRAIPWLTPPAEPRLLTFGFVLFTVLGVTAWRAAYASLLTQPAFGRRVLVVGDDAAARRLAGALRDAAQDARANPFRGSGYHVIGVLNEEQIASTGGLDAPHAFLRLITTNAIDEVLVSEGANLSPAAQEVLLDCRELGIRVGRLGPAYERLTARLPVEYAARDLGLIVSPEDSPTDRLYWFTKRLVDIVLALIGMFVMALMIPFVALANALTSPGPLFYRQQRVGCRGCSFAMYKFRTMKPDAEAENGAVWAEKDDPRVTPLGRWMRRLRLDELPQCLNVLRGEMSVVGPRPERPELVGEISRSLPIYRGRHAVRPGITGWAQIHYRYGNSVEDARIKLEYDLYYVKHTGFLLDLMILLRTLPVMLRAEGH